MRVLRLGSRGEEVERWQYFLRGAGLYLGAVDGEFGAATRAATENFQRRHGLRDDAIVGNRTFGEAMRVGFSFVDDDPAVPDSLDWPPKPPFSQLDAAGRRAAFGEYPYRSEPTADNPEAIEILSDWVRESIVVIAIPELAGVPGAPPSGRVQLHRSVAPRVAELFRKWGEAGLARSILGFGGSFVPRFIRGSRTTLSQHAHGSAFDINVPWNGLGARPAARGDRGSVRELVPIANQLGFYWGGHFARKDGMHFEVAQV
jgi:hypothetical protein